MQDRGFDGGPKTIATEASGDQQAVLDLGRRGLLVEKENGKYEPTGRGKLLVRIGEATNGFNITKNVDAITERVKVAREAVDKLVKMSDLKHTDDYYMNLVATKAGILGTRVVHDGRDFPSSVLQLTDVELAQCGVTREELPHLNRIYNDVMKKLVNRKRNDGDNGELHKVQDAEIINMSRDITALALVVSREVPSYVKIIGEQRVDLGFVWSQELDRALDADLERSNYSQSGFGAEHAGNDKLIDSSAHLMALGWAVEEYILRRVSRRTDSINDGSDARAALIQASREGNPKRFVNSLILPDPERLAGLEESRLGQYGNMGALYYRQDQMRRLRENPNFLAPVRDLMKPAE